MGLAKDKRENKLSEPLELILKDKTSASLNNEYIRNWVRFMTELRDSIEGWINDYNAFRVLLDVKVNDEIDKLIRPIQKSMREKSNRLSKTIDAFQQRM